MQTAALIVACLACAGSARRVLPAQAQANADQRLEVFVVENSKASAFISERIDKWAARGLAMLPVTCQPATAWQGVSGASPAARRVVGSAHMQRAMMAPQMSVGLYYSTSTGNTETVAEYIAGAAGVEDWKDIGDADDGEVEGHDSIIVGAPTWHTGADSERSGTSWDEWLYNTLPNMDLSGKKVAIFGVGDSGSYSDNYCDAAGELYDQFTARGAKVFGMTPSDEGYDYTESKSVVDNKFVGRMFDEDNYSDESEERAKAWVEQLKSEGFM
mmetsp:Transcript_57318/g.104698  ORF Transcript_57318/g.104698 Transcript_57318/m.104698 type:complete len:272 (-) Transcript_57318:279-1094(-)